MLRRALVTVVLTLAAAAAAFGQAKPEEARKELDLGGRAYRNGRFEEAEQHFRRALELDPEGKNTRLFIARAVQQQYKPGLRTPKNLAAGEKAVAAFQDILKRDPGNEDAYKAIVFLYGQMQNEEKVNELLLARANDFSLSNDKRAEAFTILASKQWKCSYDITERKENMTTEQQPDKVVTHYKLPADQGDFIRARQCATNGQQFAEQAISLAPKHPNAWSYKASLMREAAKLAEMEGDAAQQAEYWKQYEEALAYQKSLADEALQAAGEQPAAAAPTDAVVGESSERPNATMVKKGVVFGGVLNGKALGKPEPEYPSEARAAGVQGTVTVKVLVDEAGQVAEAEVVSGPRLLHAAAAAAARSAHFPPTRLNGQPVKVSGVITYNFVLQ